jgi:hypothetical protein
VGAQTPPPEESGSTCRECEQLKVLGGKEIIFAALVDHPDLTVPLGFRIRPDLVHLTLDEIDVLVFARIDTECVSASLRRRRFLSHGAR